MSEMLIGYPKLNHKFSYGGGAWQAGYPATNASNPTYAKVARSIDLQPENTQIILTSAYRYYLKLIGFFAHNMDLSAGFRISCYDHISSPEILLYQSNIERVWQSVYDTSVRPFETENWWTGQYTDEERANQIPSRTVILPDNIACSKIVVEFFNETNPKGFIDIGLLEISSAITLEPLEQPVWGSNWGYISESKTTRLDGGLLQAEIYAPSYVFQGEIGAMENIKARGAISELFRQYGNHKPFMWIPFPDDQLTNLRESKMVTNENDNLLSYLTNEYMNFSLNLREWKG
jgi:hypothetical protein